MLKFFGRTTSTKAEPRRANDALWATGQGRPAAASANAAAPRVPVGQAPRLDQTESVPAGDGRAIGHILHSKGADSKAPVLTDITQLPPHAELISDMHGELPLKPEEQQLMCFLRVSQKEILLLVCTDIWNSARMYSQRQRAMRDAGVMPEFVRASRDIVAICYKKFALGGTAGKGAQRDPTEVEKQAFAILDEAIAAGASDLHIEARQGHAEIYIRVDGFRRRLKTLPSLPFSDAESIGRVLYNVHADDEGKDAAWDPKKVQDAVVEHYTNDKTHVQLRFNSGPIYPAGGFQIVIRFLRMNQSQTMKLARMGYSDHQQRQLDLALAGARGLVLLAGPTNSGKSTSMQALINRVYERRGTSIKISSVEDPVEYIIPGACQVGVPSKRRTGAEQDSAFTELLKGVLRQDSDVVMVGEIRDGDSAAVVKDLVLTGRKVFTTVHAFSAFQAFVRLREVGVPWDVLTNPGFVSGVVFQRLLPVLCPHCSVPLDQGAAAIVEDVRARLKTTSDVVADEIRIRGEGCSHCGMSGYKGRVACAEVLIPDATILELLKKNDLVAAEQYWMRKGADDAAARFARGEPWVAKYPTALAHAIVAMRQGLVDPADVEANVDVLTADDDSFNNWASTAKAYQGGLGSALQRRASRIN